MGRPRKHPAEEVVPEAKESPDQYVVWRGNTVLRVNLVALLARARDVGDSKLVAEARVALG